MQDWEHQTSLLQFAKGKHKVAFYWVEPFFVIAMNSRDVPKFGNKSKSSALRLPNELEVDFDIFVPEKPYDPYDGNLLTERCKAHVETHPMGIKGDYQTFLIVADKSLRYLAKADLKNEHPKYYEVTGFEPHPPNFLLKSQTDDREVGSTFL